MGYCSACEGGQELPSGVVLVLWLSLEGNMKHVGKWGVGCMKEHTAQESGRTKGLVRKHKHTLTNFCLRTTVSKKPKKQNTQLRVTDVFMCQTPVWTQFTRTLLQ